MFTKEQQQVISFDGGNVLVSASAGSGKTTVMIERLISLISEGKANVNEILAVTFTQAAALEMKVKLKNAIIKKINEGKENLQKQLNEVSFSDISTIDAYSAKLVRSYFFEAGVSPDFEIADENKADDLKEQAVKNLFRKLYKDGGEFYTYIDRFSKHRNDSELKKNILAIYDFLSTESDFKSTCQKYNGVEFSYVMSLLKDYYLKEANYSLKEVEEIASLLKPYSLQKANDIVNEFIINLTNIVNEQDIYKYKNIPICDSKIGFGGKDETLTILKTRLQNIKKRLKKKKDFLSEVLTDIKTDEKYFNEAKKSEEYLLSLAEKFDLEYSELKREENLLDFADIEHYALKVLSSQDILQAVKEKYKYVFVDEYQDVNGIQEEIITRLTSNNLFMVGDEKQSIYGFRGCRPEFFNKKYHDMKNNGETTINLNANFRSAPAVIDTVNAVFNYSMTKDYYGIDYQKDASLIKSDCYNGYDGRATLHIAYKEKKENEKEEPRIYDIKQAIENGEKTEDDVTVSLITKIILDELGKEYYDAKEKKVKKVTLNDIVILARNKNGKYIDNLVKGLYLHGIDVSAMAEEDICDFPEVQQAISFIRLIDCFNQDIPLVSTLKSKVVNCSNDDLSTIVDFYNENVDDSDKYKSTFLDAFNYYIKHGEGELHNRLIKFCDYVKEIRFISDFKTVGEILEKVIDDFSLRAFFYAERGGETKVKRLQRLIDYCNERSLSVKGLLNQIESGEKKITLTNNGKEKCVKIMTIHSSKGLEFPVVIVCGLEKQFNTEDIKGDILFDRSLGLAVTSFNDRERTKENNVLRAVSKISVKKKIEKEELRLLYVALTRASYSLHLTAVVAEDKRGEKVEDRIRFFDFIPPSLPAVEYTMDDFKFVNIKSSVRQVIISQETETGIKQMKKTLEFSYPYACDTILPLKSTVTEANKLSEKEIFTYDLTKDVEGGSTTNQGIIAHRIMQYYDFNDSDFDGQIKGMIGAKILEKEDIENLDLSKIKKAVNCDTFKTIENKQTFREKSFLIKIKAKEVFENTLSDESILLQGIIDLIVCDGDCAEIIDYKYSDASSSVLKQRYKKQLELYGLAVENVLGFKKVRKKIVSLLTGEITDID